MSLSIRYVASIPPSASWKQNGKTEVRLSHQRIHLSRTRAQFECVAEIPSIMKPTSVETGLTTMPIRRHSIQCVDVEQVRQGPNCLRKLAIACFIVSMADHSIPMYLSLHEAEQQRRLSTSVVMAHGVRSTPALYA